MNTKNEVALFAFISSDKPLPLSRTTQGTYCQAKMSKSHCSGGEKKKKKNIPQIIGLSKDEADSLPMSNTVSQHVPTHLNGTAIDPGGQERGFSHQRDSFLLKHKNIIINPYMQLKGIITQCVNKNISVN